MIIIYSSKTDISAQKAALELSLRGIDFMLVDPSESVFSTKLEHRLGGSSKRGKFTLSIENEEVDLDDISVIYVRH